MQNELPLISVIIPVYNVESYLDRCVESVVGQTYTNLEIILVDDGSPDNSPTMCDNWAAKDARIKVIHKENGGLSSARNSALDIMKGEYLTFVDSDDYIDKNAVEIMYNRILNDNSDIAICNYKCVTDNSDDYWDNTYPLKDEILSKNEILRKLVEYNHWHYVIACCKLYKKQLFDSIRFPVGKLHEDVFTAHLIFDLCARVSCLSSILYYYYQAPESITHNYSINSLDIIDGYLNRLDFFIEKNMEYESALSAETVAEKILQAYDRLDMNETENKSVINGYKREYDKRYRLIRNNKQGNYKFRYLFHLGIKAVKLKAKLIK